MEKKNEETAIHKIANQWWLRLDTVPRNAYRGFEFAAVNEALASYQLAA
jgi:hypothetical protein